MRKISEETYDLLLETIIDGMYHWSPSSDFADWECIYCNRRPKTNHDSIVHDDNCEGNKLLQALYDTEEI